MVIGKLRRASEGVKEKPLCWHLLLCQHLPSCSYSISPFVRPSTKVSPLSHASVRICVRALIVFVPRNIIENSNRRASSCENSIQHMFYIQSTQLHLKNNQRTTKNGKRTRRTALIQSWRSHSMILISFFCMFT